MRYIADSTCLGLKISKKIFKDFIAINFHPARQKKSLYLKKLELVICFHHHDMFYT